MKNQKELNRALMGIIAVILWAIILTIFLISALDHLEVSSVVWPSILAVCGAVLVWISSVFVKMRRFSNRLNNAALQFQIKRNIKEYFSELDELEKINGNRPIGKMQAKEYFTYLRIVALKMVGRKEEAGALLEAALKEATSDRAILLLKAEEAHWN